MTTLIRICCCSRRCCCCPPLSTILLFLIILINFFNSVNAAPPPLQDDDKAAMLDEANTGDHGAHLPGLENGFAKAEVATAAAAANHHNHYHHHDHQNNGHHNNLRQYKRRLLNNHQHRPQPQNGKNGFIAHKQLHKVPKIVKELKRVDHYDASALVQNDNQLQVLIADAIDWAQNNGLIMRSREHANKSDVAVFAPFTLFPTAFPRALFHEAVDVQTAMQLLYFRITHDLEFLKNVHKDVIQTDQVVRSFIEIIEKVHNEGIRQPITLFFQRADYMLHSAANHGDHNEHEQQYELKQIEVNGCALGGAGFAPLSTELHRRMLKKAGIYAPKSNVPENRIDVVTATALYSAWQEFGNPEAVVLFLVDTKADRLTFDRRLIQYAFERVSHDQVDVVRLSLTECMAKLMLDPVDFSLRLVEDERVVAVVFNQVLMLGSSPSHMELDARLMIERSTAIKAPSLVFALSHSKKIQQALSVPGVVERFFPSPAEAHLPAKIRRTFAGLWGFEAAQDHAKNAQLIQMATRNPERFVLKPIGEGCGQVFNYFDEKIPEKLAKMKPAEFTDYILMEKLMPKVYKNHFIRPFREPLLNVEVTTELGISGCLMGNLNTGEIMFNQQGGHGFKTKLATEKEGGICAGTGMIDTPYLVDD